MSALPRYDLTRLAAAAGLLAERDPDLGLIFARYGPPPLWDRPPGLGTLIHIILEQQVSLASARAAYDRLCAAVQPLTPQGLLALSDAELKAIGFSRQKTAYARELCLAVLEGRFAFEPLEDLDDETVRTALTALKGIGRWTADIYLVMVLCRADVFPVGDLALVNALRSVKRLPAGPLSSDDLETLTAPWRPHRAAAARMLWQWYLGERNLLDTPA